MADAAAADAAGQVDAGGAGGPEVVVAFDPDAFELPEGLALRDGQVFVGLAPTGAVVRVDPDTGEVAPFAQFPSPPLDQGFLAGLAFDRSGALFGAVASFARDVAPGIYRAEAGGGEAVLFAQHPDLVVPNGLVFDADGQLWVTDSTAGAVFRVAPDGTASLVARDELLAGRNGFCPSEQPGASDFGANGIAVVEGAVFVANTDRASVVRIKIADDGSAQSIDSLVGPLCGELDGADGLTLASDGSLLVASNRLDRLSRVGLDGSIELLFAGPPLEFPANLAVSGDGPDAVLWITNFALDRVQAGQPAAPALLRMPLPE